MKDACKALRKRCRNITNKQHEEVEPVLQNKYECNLKETLRKWRNDQQVKWTHTIPKYNGKPKIDLKLDIDKLVNLWVLERVLSDALDLPHVFQQVRYFEMLQEFLAEFQVRWLEL